MRLTYRFHPAVDFPARFLQPLSSALRHVHPASGSQAGALSSSPLDAAEGASGAAAAAAPAAAACARSDPAREELLPGAGASPEPAPAPLQGCGRQEAGPAPATALRLLKGARSARQRRARGGSLVAPGEGFWALPCGRGPPASLPFTLPSSHPQHKVSPQEFDASTPTLHTPGHWRHPHI